jgi:hypothetical protein
MVVIELVLQLLAGHALRPLNLAKSPQKFLKPCMPSRDRTGHLFLLVLAGLKLGAKGLSHRIGHGGGPAGSQLACHGMHFRILDVHAHGAIRVEKMKVLPLLTFRP